MDSVDVSKLGNNRETRKINKDGGNDPTFINLSNFSASKKNTQNISGV